MTIGERLFHLLDSRNIEQKELAHALGISYSSVSNWKQRKTDPPANYLATICDFLDISIEFLVTGENDENHVKKCTHAPDLTFIIDKWDSLDEAWKGIIKGKVCEGFLECQKSDQNVAKIS